MQAYQRGDMAQVVAILGRIMASGMTDAAAVAPYEQQARQQAPSAAIPDMMTTQTGVQTRVSTGLPKSRRVGMMGGGVLLVLLVVMVLILTVFNGGGDDDKPTATDKPTSEASRQVVADAPSPSDMPI